MFNVGDKIVYPMHGAGVIDAIEEKDILGGETILLHIKNARRSKSNGTNSKGRRNRCKKCYR